MAASVVDLVRPAQKSIASTPAPAPKPTRRFDDVLASSRQHARPEPKAETPAQHGKTESDKANKPKADPAKAEEPKKTDNTTDDTEASHEDKAGDSTQAAKPTKKPTPAKKPKAHDGEAKDDGSDGEANAATAEAKPAEAKPAAPVETDLAVDPKKNDAEKTSDEKHPTADAGTAQPDPTALAAQLNTAPAPTADVSTEAPQSDDATATAAVANATTSAASAATTASAKPAAKAQAGTAPALGDEAAPIDGEHRPTLKAVAEQAPVDPDEAAAAAFQLPADFEKATSKTADTDTADPIAALQAAIPHDKAPAHTAMPAVPQAAPDAAPKTVAENNVDHIVTSVRGELLTKGGTMQIRLDPPSLGAINVQVSFDDGVMSASFQTNNDEATRMLSHNLSQLKSQLESTGVTVDHIQVKQAAPSEQSSASNQQSESDRRESSRETGQEQSAHQEQQRREMLARMWAKLSGNGDPLDLVA